MISLLFLNSRPRKEENEQGFLLVFYSSFFLRYSTMVPTGSRLSMGVRPWGDTSLISSV